MTRIALAAVGGLSALALITLAVLPDRMHVERSAVVRGTPHEVTHYAAHFPDRPSWVAWTEIDPAATYDFTGSPGAPGATMSWVGTEIGEATLTLEHVEPGRRVVSSLTYTAPFSMTSTDRLEVEDLGDGTTRVTWRAEGDLPFGPLRLFGVFADGLLGPDDERGLVKLDHLLADQRS